MKSLRKIIGTCILILGAMTFTISAEKAGKYIDKIKATPYEPSHEYDRKVIRLQEQYLEKLALCALSTVTMTTGYFILKKKK